MINLLGRMISSSRTSTASSSHQPSSNFLMGTSWPKSAILYHTSSRRTATKQSNASQAWRRTQSQSIPPSLLRNTSTCAPSPHTSFECLLRGIGTDGVVCNHKCDIQGRLQYIYLRAYFQKNRHSLTAVAGHVQVDTVLVAIPESITHNDIALAFSEGEAISSIAQCS